MTVFDSLIFKIWRNKYWILSESLKVLIKHRVYSVQLKTTQMLTLNVLFPKWFEFKWNFDQSQMCRSEKFEWFSKGVDKHSKWRNCETNKETETKFKKLLNQIMSWDKGSLVAQIFWGDLMNTHRQIDILCVVGNEQPYINEKIDLTFQMSFLELKWVSSLSSWSEVGQVPTSFPFT